MNARVLCGLCLTLALAGCRNLELPPADALNLADGGRSPYLALDFESGATVALSAPLSFTANSLEGLSEVSVFCGAQALARWTTPPFQGQVDLTPCVPPLPPSDGGVDLRELSLVAVAVDTHGHRTDLPFTLKVDVSVPVLTTDLPERIRPGRPLDFTLRASLPPAELPVVTLADLPVTLTRDPADARLFHAHLPKTPALGIDALDGGAVTLDVLQDVERTVKLEAEAMAPNGNRGKLLQSVLLTRVLWDKPLPAPLAQEAYPFQPQPVDAPTAISGGLVVPLSASIAVATRFYPAVYAADSGAITLDQPLLDGGWAGFAIDEEGWLYAESYLSRSQGWLYGFINPTDTTQAFTFPDGGSPPAQPLVRGEGALCGLTNGICGSTAATLQCVDHRGTTSTDGKYLLGTATNPEDGGTSELVAARSGDSVFFGGYQQCADTTPTFAVGTRDGGLTFAPANTLQPYTGYSCQYAQLYPVLPTGDGAFVLFSHKSCINGVTGAREPDPYGFGILVGPDAGTLGSYDLVRPINAVSGIMGTWGPDHAVMVLQATPVGTQLSLFPPDGGASTVASTLPGVYGYPADLSVSGALTMPRDVIRGTDGLAVLTAGSSTTRALVRLGPELEPRWVYRYPRLATTSSVHLYSFDENGPLYLVDSFNQRVVAIER